MPKKMPNKIIMVTPLSLSLFQYIHTYMPEGSSTVPYTSPASILHPLGALEKIKGLSSLTLGTKDNVTRWTKKRGVE